MNRRQVFVSYSHPDRECAMQLTAQLEAQGIAVWIAPRDISPAADWAEEIIEAISAARVMILVFSSHCNTSPQVRREVERAIHRGVPVLPFRIEDVLPSRSLEYFLSTQHWLDAFPPPRQPYYVSLAMHVTAILNGTVSLGSSGSVSPMSAQVPGQPVPAAIVSGETRIGVSGHNALLSLDVTEMESLERRMARYIGPIAKVIVKRAAAKATTRDELTHLLAAELDAEAARTEFLQSCQDRAAGRSGLRGR